VPKVDDLSGEEELAEERRVFYGHDPRPRRIDDLHAIRHAGERVPDRC
jgi:hypothetical protein